jgi:hypothetical protein
MKKADYQLIGNIFASIGGGLIVLAVLVFLIGGLRIGRDFWGNVTSLSFPNTLPAATLGVAGIILAAIGGAFRSRAGQEPSIPPSFTRS